MAVADEVLKTAIDVPADPADPAVRAVQIVDLGRAAVQADSLATGSARAGTYTGHIDDSYRDPDPIYRVRVLLFLFSRP